MLEAFKEILFLLEMHKRGFTWETVKIMKIDDKKVVIIHEGGVPLSEYRLDGEMWRNSDPKTFVDWIDWSIKEDGHNLLSDKRRLKKLNK